MITIFVGACTVTNNKTKYSDPTELKFSLPSQLAHPSLLSNISAFIKPHIEIDPICDIFQLQLEDDKRSTDQFATTSAYVRVDLTANIINTDCVSKPEKVRTSTGFEPVTSRYRCDALTN